MPLWDQWAGYGIMVKIILAGNSNSEVEVLGKLPTLPEVLLKTMIRLTLIATLLKIL